MPPDCQSLSRQVSHPNRRWFYHRRTHVTGKSNARISSYIFLAKPQTLREQPLVIWKKTMQWYFVAALLTVLTSSQVSKPSDSTISGRFVTTLCVSLFSGSLFALNPMNLGSAMFGFWTELRNLRNFCSSSAQIDSVWL